MGGGRCRWRLGLREGNDTVTDSHCLPTPCSPKPGHSQLNTEREVHKENDGGLPVLSWPLLLASSVPLPPSGVPQSA